MDRAELELLIPSETVREYVQETGWSFTDFQKAALLVHRGLPLKEEYAYLKELSRSTDDSVLKGQIEEYTREMEKGFLAFKANSNRNHIYVLKVREEGGYWDGKYLATGYFFNLNAALDFGKKADAPFEIEKYQVDEVTVFDDSTCSHNPVGELRFDRDKEAVCLWSNEIGKPRFDNRRFDEAIIEIPNPYERGDIVRCKGRDGKEMYGMVEARQEDWKERLARNLERVENGDHGLNFMDLFISVAFLCEDGTFDYCDDVTPLELERYEPRNIDWTNGSPDTLLLCARDICCGNGHISLLFEVLKKYRQSIGIGNS